MPDQLTITPDEAAEVYEYADDALPAVVGAWTVHAQQHIRTGRWEEHYWLVLSHTDHEGLWGLRYAHGLTEMQDSTLPWDDTDQPLTLVRVYPKTITTTVYTKTPPEADR